MKRLLTTKAWKLVIAMIVLPPIVLVAIEVIRHFYYVWLTGDGPPIEENGWMTVFTMAWFFAIFSLPFLWQYQVGTRLTKRLAAGRTYSNLKFRFSMIVPATIIIVLIMATFIQEKDTDGLTVSESRVQEVLFFLFLVTYLIGFFFRYRQMGKTLHWVDVASGRQPRGNAVNLLLSLFWWVGIWFLQPRVRAVWKDLQERSVEEHFIEE